MSRSYAVALIGLCSLGLWIGVTTARATSDQLSSTQAESAVSMTTVSEADLGAADVSLTPPTATPTVTADRAWQVVLDNSPAGSEVIESVLADVTYSRVGIDAQLCWVISLGPQGSIPMPGDESSRPLFANWTLAFVDATTGQWLDTVQVH